MLILNSHTVMDARRIFIISPRTNIICMFFYFHYCVHRDVLCLTLRISEYIRQCIGDYSLHTWINSPPPRLSLPFGLDNTWPESFQSMEFIEWHPKWRNPINKLQIRPQWMSNPPTWMIEQMTAASYWFYRGWLK